jgi:hypothetical protein
MLIFVISLVTPSLMVILTAWALSAECDAERRRTGKPAIP